VSSKSSGARSHELEEGLRPLPRLRTLRLILGHVHPHDDAALRRKLVEGKREPFAVLGRPGRADVGPAGLVAVADDIEQAVAGTIDGGCSHCRSPWLSGWDHSHRLHGETFDPSPERGDQRLRGTRTLRARSCTSPAAWGRTRKRAVLNLARDGSNPMNDDGGFGPAIRARETGAMYAPSSAAVAASITESEMADSPSGPRSAQPAGGRDGAYRSRSTARSVMGRPIAAAWCQSEVSGRSG